MRYSLLAAPMRHLLLAALVVGFDLLISRVLGATYGLFGAACVVCAIFWHAVIEAIVDFLVAKRTAILRRLRALLNWCVGFAILASPFYVPPVMPGGLWVRLGTLFGLLFTVLALTSRIPRRTEG